LKRKVSEKLSLDEICGRFSYSKSFLCKTFKLQTGDTIIAYFNKLKIDEAKKRLTETNQNITAIAYSLGFQEVKYFDYTFKKYTGVSPAAYRKGVKNI
ncbi:MAG: helix-turn-helix transcriptional regulator, partial [Clostridia bacterium]|nr:helix-turn-helix transcriptional regulator [Clostridia bacterium]